MQKYKIALCRQLSGMCLLPEVAPNSFLDTAKRMGKCNADIKMLMHSRGNESRLYLTWMSRLPEEIIVKTDASFIHA